MPRIVTLTPNPALDYAVETATVSPNAKLRCERPRTDPGGGGINVSRAAARLGVETLAVFTAGGSFGRELTKALELERVPSRVVPIGGDTRITFHVKETSSGDEFRFGLPGAPLAREEYDALLANVEDAAAPGDFVVGSGSLPPGAPEFFYARAGAAAKRKGARFVLDTTDGLDDALAEGLYLLRINNADSHRLFGKTPRWPDESESLARTLLEDGAAEKIVMANSGEGAILVARDGTCFAASIKVEIASAVGAGDSFVAGLLAAMLRGDGDEAALRFAMAAAAGTLMSPGTALFDPKDVERLYRAAQPPRRGAKSGGETSIS